MAIHFVTPVLFLQKCHHLCHFQTLVVLVVFSILGCWEGFSGLCYEQFYPDHLLISRLHVLWRFLFNGWWFFPLLYFKIMLDPFSYIYICTPKRNVSYHYWTFYCQRIISVYFFQLCVYPAEQSHPPSPNLFQQRPVI